MRIAFLAYCGDTNGECKMYREGVSHGAALLHNDTVHADVKHINKLEVSRCKDERGLDSIFLNCKRKRVAF